MDNQIEIIRSCRKTASIQIRPNGAVVFRAPMGMPEEEIRRILQEKQNWIKAHREKAMINQKHAVRSPLTAEDLRSLAQEAAAALPPVVKEYAARMGVTYGRVTIRNQVSRWGSCSASGNLNFNCLLMLAPPEVREYVVVHELAHRRHMDHSAAFWQEVEDVMPNYREQVRWLKENGGELIARMRCGERKTCTEL